MSKNCFQTAFMVVTLVIGLFLIPSNALSEDSLGDDTVQQDSVVQSSMDNMADANQSEYESIINVSQIFMTIFWLLFVIGLILLIAWAARKYYPQVFGGVSKSALQSSNQIEVISMKSMGPKRMLYLIRVGNKEILVGAHEQGITALGQWDTENGVTEEFAKVMKKTETDIQEK